VVAPGGRGGWGAAPWGLAGAGGWGAA